jgi:hypothetical protein
MQRCGAAGARWAAGVVSGVLVRYAAAIILFILFYLPDLYSHLSDCVCSRYLCVCWFVRGLAGC